MELEQLVRFIQIQSALNRSTLQPFTFSKSLVTFLCPHLQPLLKRVHTEQLTLSLAPMAEYMPGSWDYRRHPTSANTPSGGSHQRRNTMSSRPGKFTNLYKFARPEPSNRPASGSEPVGAEQLVDYKCISSRGLAVRHIIHIKDIDTNSRIHDRIMLVVREESGSAFTCLTFCTHSEPEVIHETHCQDHARLISHAEEQEAHHQENQYFNLCIILGLGDRNWKPQKDAYINLRELWHIESSDGVEFGVLGKACAQSWPRALEQIIHVFASSMRAGPRRTSGGSDSRPTLPSLSPKIINEPKDKEEDVPRRRKSVRVVDDAEGADSDVDRPDAYYTTRTPKKTGGLFGPGMFARESKTFVVEDSKGHSKSYRGHRSKKSYDKD